jgi:hypothetical protein
LLADRAKRMAKQDLSDAQWTQEYCSQGYGFCAPVHKNWWYKSFLGGTDIIRVELGPDEIDAPNNGPIVISLQSGGVASRQAADGDVRTQGDLVYGFREWSANRHFEVWAPASLETAVRYIIQHIAAR